MDDCVFTEGGCAKKVIYGTPVLEEPCIAVAKHHAPIGVDSKKVAHVALLRLAVRALLAFSGEDGKYVISLFKIRHAFTDTLHNSVIGINKTRYRKTVGDKNS